ncbi:MAG: hypothetical protein IK099_10620 [Clostridia bacterium]|nr:hypothetical protein [Clostridia bacterium]
MREIVLKKTGRPLLSPRKARRNKEEIEGQTEENAKSNKHRDPSHSKETPFGGAVLLLYARKAGNATVSAGIFFRCPLL